VTKQRKVLLTGSAAAAVAVVLSLPAVHWRLVGWWRGEAFFNGRPSSYYAARAHRLRLWEYVVDKHRVVAASWTYPVGPFADIRERLRLPVRRAAVEPGDLLPTDPDAVPVLTEILDRLHPFGPDQQVLFHAALALGDIGPPARAALPALKRLADAWSAMGDGDFLKRGLRDVIDRIEATGAGEWSQ
jgi:hypothetical protein